MYCIGLTGNIASGKSTVAGFFASLGIKIISADKIARDLTKKGTKPLNDIINHFGSSYLKEDGELNRQKLRELIFTNSTDRKWLEDLLHPLIRQEIINGLCECKSNYCIIEIPLLYDRAKYPYLKRVLMVKTSKDTQIERLMIRDNCSKEDAMAIINSQIDIDSLYNVADDVLLNQSDNVDISKQIAVLHDKYMLYAINELDK